MIRFETSVLDAKYYEHEVSVSHPVAEDTMTFSCYTTFKDDWALEQLLRDVNPNVTVHVDLMRECGPNYQKSSSFKHYSLNQMYAILKTMRFTRLETRKKYKIIEVSETVAVDYTDGTEKTVSQTKDKVFNSWEEFEDDLAARLFRKEGEK